MAGLFHRPRHQTKGIELARELLAKRPGLPVLMTSGYTAQGIIPAGLADELRVLRKPHGQADLSQAIRDLMIGGRKPARD